MGLFLFRSNKQVIRTVMAKNGVTVTESYASMPSAHNDLSLLLLFNVDMP